MGNIPNIITTSIERRQLARIVTVYLAGYALYDRMFMDLSYKKLTDEECEQKAIEDFIGNLSRAVADQDNY